MASVYEESIRDEFTHQAESFARSAAMSSAEMLGALAQLVPEDAGASWIEVACGPGLVAREIAGRVGSVRGVDLTPAMLETARREAAARGIGNVEFSEGDATALRFDGDGFDGAITRFSLHHIPAPARVVAEMARVVRPGGLVVVGDLVTDADADAAAWHQEIDRLRDPSHWATLGPARLRAIGEAAGLMLDSERIAPIELDFDEWLERGSGGAAAASLIDRLVADPPAGAESFRVVERDGGRYLQLRYWLSRWRVPGQS
jgi:SAM-dependent methyltransferase